MLVGLQSIKKAVRKHDGDLTLFGHSNPMCISPMITFPFVPIKSQKCAITSRLIGQCNMDHVSSRKHSDPNSPVGSNAKAILSYHIAYA